MLYEVITDAPGENLSAGGTAQFVRGGLSEEVEGGEDVDGELVETICYPPAEDPERRITSYNVCYTKLLRTPHP